jgi:hypothetical protein
MRWVVVVYKLRPDRSRHAIVVTHEGSRTRVKYMTSAHADTFKQDSIESDRWFRDRMRAPVAVYFATAANQQATMGHKCLFALGLALVFCD